MAKKKAKREAVKRMLASSDSDSDPPPKKVKTKPRKSRISGTGQRTVSSKESVPHQTPTPSVPASFPTLPNPNSFLSL